jgi:Na+/melibiose symporter-like transporter
MIESTRRSLLERLAGRPLPWLIWAWVVLAVIWIVLAFAEPSGLHTFLAIAWTVLAAVQLGMAYYRRRQERRRTHGGPDMP